MAEVEIKLLGFKCERCDHEWAPRKEGKPIICPKCKSPYWNVPKKNKLNIKQKGEHGNTRPI